MSFPHDDPDFDMPWDGDCETPEVPRDFFSEYLSAPFLKCIDCETEIQSANEAYSVIKSYVGKETVFEMAICALCSIRLAQSYSSHSKAAMESSIQRWKHPRGDHRPSNLPPADAPPPSPTPVANESEDDWDAAIPGVVVGRIEQLEHCASCGRSRSECYRYSIVGAFFGRALVSPTQASVRLPLLICDKCNSDTTESISQQTRDSWDHFVEDHFDGPPGIELDLPKVDPILI